MNNTTQERISYNTCDVLKITHIINNGSYQQIPYYTYIIVSKRKSRKTSNNAYNMTRAICVSVIGDPKFNRTNPLEVQQLTVGAQLRVTVTPVNIANVSLDDLNDILISRITSDFMSNKVLYTKQHRILFQRYLDKFQEPILSHIVENFDLIHKFAYDLDNEYSQNDLYAMVHQLDEIVDNVIGQLINDDPYIEIESMCHGVLGEVGASPIMIEDVHMFRNGRVVVRFRVPPCMLQHTNDHTPKEEQQLRPQPVSDLMNDAISINRIACGIVSISYVGDHGEISVVPLELNGVWQPDIDKEQNEPLKLVLKDIFDEVVIENKNRVGDPWFTSIIHLFVSTIEKKLHGTYRSFGAIWSGYPSFGQPNNNVFYSVPPTGQRDQYQSATFTPNNEQLRK